MNITRFSIQHPVGITMIVMLFVVLGLYSYFRIGVELLPNLVYPYVSVSVEYSGASVEEVEEEVIKPLEEALSSISHLNRMIAIAKPEKASIIMEFDFTANADVASIDATKLVNKARKSLPDDVSEPIVLRRDANSTPVMEIAVKAKYSLSDIYSKADQVFKESIQRADGVSDVELGGGRDKEVAVQADRDKLSLYNLSLAQIVSCLKKENLLLPAGTVYTDKTETDVRLSARYESPAEIKQVTLTNSAGAVIKLAEIAEVREKDSRASRYSRVNGDDAISLKVYKNSDANIVSTVKAILFQLELLKTEYPDYEFIIVSNDANYIDKSLKNTMVTLFEGIMTTGIVLFLFLRGWRSTVAVIIAIPTSLIATFLMMYLAGFTFNMMSLMGMALCIGILVDDAIVVLENIHRHLAMGKDAAVAAEEGRNEIGMAAIAITLCDVVVFVPIAFMSGMTGQYFTQFGLTIVFATLFSLFVSFTLTPMLTARLFKKNINNSHNKLWTLMDKIEDKTIKQYEKLLCWSLLHSKKIVAGVLLLFILVGGLLPAGIIGAEYMPKTDESNFQVSVELPVGQNLDATDEVVCEMEDYLLQIPEVMHCLSYVGDPSSNKGKIVVQLVDRKERKRSIWQITDDIRNFAKQNIVQGAVRVTETASSISGTSAIGSDEHTPVLIYLLGSDMKELIEAAAKAQNIMNKVPGLKDIRNTYKEGVPEYKLVIDRDKLKFFHTSVDNVKDAFASAIGGKKAGVLANDSMNFGRDTDIVVRLGDSDSFKPSDLRRIPLQSSERKVYLGDVADIQEGFGPVGITRLNKQRTIIVQANVTDRPLQEVLQDIEKQFKKEPLAKGVTYRFSGQATSMDSGFREIIQALALSLLLVYMLLAVLYESTSTPLIRMLSLPLGLIGSLLFLLITKNTINVYSLIGILVMDGLVAKNGTLLLDYTLTLMKSGIAVREALIKAGKTRLKPIFMTTLTMVVGMLPTALALNEGSETRVSMAWVLIGGLLSSTFFTLIIIPIIFLFCQQYPLSKWFNLAITYLKKRKCKAVQQEEQ